MLPPEINSARIATGPGSGSLLAAAIGWDGLATELHSAAALYGSTIAELAARQWLGLASMSMQSAASPYVAWMSTMAAQAEQAADQARAAASAYEAARSMTVPPPVIAANRGLLVSLIATNLLGQNMPAIATTEAHYGEMWAQDAAAMYGYAGASAAASRLIPFTPPRQNTDPRATAVQAMSAVPQALQELASPLPPTSPETPTAYESLMSSLNDAKSFLYPVSILSALPQRAMSMANVFKSLMSTTSTAAKEANVAGSALAGGLGSGLSALGSGAAVIGQSGSAGLGGAALSAAIGRATPIGVLSAPQTWTAAALPTHYVAPALTGSGLGTPPVVDPAGPAGVPPVAPMTSIAGNNTSSAPPRYGFRPNVIARPPAAG